MKSEQHTKLIGTSTLDALSRQQRLNSLAFDVSSMSNVDIADFAHAFTVVHSGLPNIFDLTTNSATPRHMRELLYACSHEFQSWRRFLTALTSKAGPAPTYTDEGLHLSSLLQVKQGIQLLGESERKGCAFGAATALLHDWQAILQTALCFGQKFGIAFDFSGLPEASSLIEAVDLTEPSAAEIRAMAFGSSQLYQMNDDFFRYLDERKMARTELYLA